MNAMNSPLTGIDLKVERIRYGYVSATALASRLGVSKSWVTRIEQRAAISPDDAQRYREALATFATVTTDAA